MKRVRNHGLTLALLLLLSGCITAPRTSPTGAELPIEKAIIRFQEDVADGGYRLVGTEELKQWLDTGRRVRIISLLGNRENRLLGLLPTAASAPLPIDEQELTPEDREGLLRAAGHDSGMTIVVYGGFVGCRRSHLGAKLLVDNGYKNVYRYPGGIAGWQEAGYPLVQVLP